MQVARAWSNALPHDNSMMAMGSQTTHVVPPRGTKRAAVDDLERDQRLSKRFDLLNLDTNGSKLYIASPSDHHPDANSGHASVARDNDKPSSPTQHQDTYSMEVEDTPHRIYINDLDDELADDAEPSTPARPIFMPDIEKHLLGVPMAVFKPSGEEEAARREREKAMQMVVYGVPTSLSVSEEEDNVRRAIEDARRRVRQKMPLGQYHPSPSTIHLPISQPLPTSSSTPSNYNFDMMDET